MQHIMRNTLIISFLDYHKSVFSQKYCKKKKRNTSNKNNSTRSIAKNTLFSCMGKIIKYNDPFSIRTHIIKIL